MPDIMVYFFIRLNSDTGVAQRPVVRPAGNGAFLQDARASEGTTKGV